MGRPSKLTDKQWCSIEQRHLDGESIRSLAKEFKIAESSIRDRVSARSTEIKSVANQIVATESRLKALPISAQVSAHNLADRLRSISEHLCGAAAYGAATAHRLAGIANAQADLVDDANPQAVKSAEALSNIAGLTKMANASSEIGVNLLRANKETIDAMNNKPPEDDKAAPMPPVLSRDEWLVAHGIGQ